MRASRCVLSAGSNVGDRLGHLRLVVDAFIDDHPAVSPVYETAPWGRVDQDDFLNLVVVAVAELDPRGWLRRAQACEQAAGRVREQRWGPRTLDVDLIVVDSMRSADPDLMLPHPRAHLRASVLRPWLDVDPGAELPGRGPVADLLAALPATERDGVRRRDDLRVPGGGR